MMFVNHSVSPEIGAKCTEAIYFMSIVVRRNTSISTQQGSVQG